MLQELVEPWYVRIQSLRLEVASFLVGDLSLEAYDISVRDIALGEGVLRFHGFDHAGFDLLGKDTELARRVAECAYVTS